MSLSIVKYWRALDMRSRVHELFVAIGQAHHRAGWPS